MITCPYCREENDENNNICVKCGSKISENIYHKGMMLDNRYEVLELIGKGGMGYVYKAIDLKLNNSIVAIKEMIVDGIPEERLNKAIESFKKEASILVELRHPALPRIIDFFSEGYKRWYLVMDFIEGETLDTIIKKKGKLPEKLVLNYFKQLCNVLNYLHTNEPPIIFRDLKPSNIMVTSNNKIVLIDFGIAKIFESNMHDEDVTWSFSPGFAPPEQMLKNEIGFFTDIYSLGLVLYYLLTGINPTNARNNKYMELKKLRISSDFKDAIIQCLENNPNDRPHSIKELQVLVVKKTKYIELTNKRLFKLYISLLLCITLMSFIYSSIKINFFDKDNNEVPTNANITKADELKDNIISTNLTIPEEATDDIPVTIQSDFVISNNAKMSISMENDEFYDASPALVYKIADLLNNSSKKLDSKINKEFDFIIKIDGLPKVYLNKYNYFYFENSESTIYETNEDVQKISTLICRDEENSNVYKFMDKIILQSAEADLNNDKINEKIELIYNNNIELLINDSRTIVFEEYWNIIDYDLVETKFDLFRQKNTNIVNIVVTFAQFTNKIGSSEDIDIYYYEDKTIHKIWDISKAYEPLIYTILLNDTVNISIPEFEYSKNLSEYYFESAKKGLEKYKTKNEDVFYVGTNMYSKIIDYNNDGIDELVTTRTFGGPDDYLEGVCKTYYEIDGMDVRATGIEIEPMH